MVNPEKILKELSRLWVDMAQEERAHVLRACAMTLITINEETEDPISVGETIAMLMKEHPSRSMLIRLRDSDEPLLESRVFAQCWMPFGQHRQICCEQIEITASSASLDDVPGVVLPLTVPDLPVILWCRSPGLFGRPVFPQIAAMADKLIVDSGEFASAPEALDLIAEKSRGGILMADLAWARITRWRQTLSQVFVNEECLKTLASFTEAVVEYGGDKPLAEAFYLAAWLQNGLERVGNHTAVALVKADGPAVTALRLSGGNLCPLSIRADRAGVVEVEATRLSNRTVFPPMTDYLTLQEELAITQHDPEFEAVLPVALAIASRA